MREQTDEIFHFSKNILTPLPFHPMREGLLGKTLEDALQTFLEKYPQIIPGKQIDPTSENPPHFVLLRREMPVGGWSLDHLFVDQNGVLTLVEDKLFQNPESRRDVIGQIIEYAANARDSWSGGNARQKAAEFWANHNPPYDLDNLLCEEFGQDLDIEYFWKRVEENLGNNRMRLIIAADELRAEVRRMIEYLNNEMQNAEVLGLELRLYGEEAESMVLVPRLIGQTQSSIDRKSSTKSIQWTVEKLETAYDELSDFELGCRLKDVLQWSLEKGCFISTSALNPAFGLQGISKSRIVSFFSDGSIYLYIDEKHYARGFEERDELVHNLKKLRLLPQDLNPLEVISGRNLSKNLSELSETGVEELLKVLGEYCV